MRRLGHLALLSRAALGERLAGRLPSKLIFAQVSGIQFNALVHSRPDAHCKWMITRHKLSNKTKALRSPKLRLAFYPTGRLLILAPSIAAVAKDPEA